MEEVFFHKKNFEMLYNVISDDMKIRYDIQLELLNIDSRSILYHSMINVFNNIENISNESLESINKNVLKMCIPIIINNRNENYADKQLNVFVSEESEKEKIEDLNGTTLDIEKKIEEATKVIIEKELDIYSGDRENVGSSKDTPYDFTVHFGKDGTNPGISTVSTFKNVESIHLTHVIIADTTYNNIDKYPFLWLQIEQITGVYISTSNHGRKSLVKLIREKKWSENTNSIVSYNLMQQKVGFSISKNYGWKGSTPIASLSKFSVKLLTPSGNVIQSNTFKDVFSINHIVDDTTNNTLDIICNDTVTDENCNQYNRLIFKDLRIDNNFLSNYLENKEHIVSSIDSSSKKITIEKQPSGVNEDGTYTYDTYGDGTASYGFILNASLQTSISFCIKCVTYSNQINKDLNIV